MTPPQLDGQQQRCPTCESDERTKRRRVTRRLPKLPGAVEGFPVEQDCVDSWHDTQVGELGPMRDDPIGDEVLQVGESGSSDEGERVTLHRNPDLGWVDWGALPEGIDPPEHTESQDFVPASALQTTTQALEEARRELKELGRKRIRVSAFRGESDPRCPTCGLRLNSMLSEQQQELEDAEAALQAERDRSRGLREALERFIERLAQSHYEEEIRGVLDEAREFLSHQEQTTGGAG